MKLRESIFETNSSSCHSCVIKASTKLLDCPNLSDDGVLYVELRDFGWEREEYTDVETKLSYAGTLAVIQHSYKPSLLELFLEVCIEHTGAKRVDFLNIYIPQDGKVDFQDLSEYSGGSVDHQSVEEMTDKIFKNKKSLKNFLFNPDSILTTDSDG